MAKVVVDHTALRRAWQRNKPDGFVWASLKSNGDPFDLAAAADKATASAEALLNQPPAPDRLGEVTASPSPDGAILFLEGCDTAETLQVWLDMVSHGVEEAGHSGNLVAAKPGISAVERQQPLDAICLVLSLRMDLEASISSATLNRHEAGWFVDDNLTHRIITRAVEWCGEVPGEWWFGNEDTSFAIDRAAAAKLTSSWLQRLAAPRIRCEQGANLFRNVKFGPQGRVIFEQRHNELSPVAIVNDFMELLRENAQWLDYGFIKRSAAITPSEGFLLSTPPVPPKVTPWYVSYGRSLEATHVPDAFGAQLLTDAHLAPLSLDPARWSIVEVTEGRAVVAARDLGPWFPGPPGDELLAAARQDFDPILVDEEAARAAWKRHRGLS